MTGTLPVTMAGVGPGEGGGEAGSLVECGFEHADRIRAATIATTRRSGACLTVRVTSIPSILIIVFEGGATTRHLSTTDRSPGSRPAEPAGSSNTVGWFYGWVPLEASLVRSTAGTSKSCLFEATAGRGGSPGSAVCSQAFNSGMSPSGPVYNAHSHRN